MSKSTAFERVQEARNPDRPYTLDIIDRIFSDFSEIHGDRRFGDDPAMVCGFARLDGREVAIVGQQKGRDINERRHRNFAMTKPEGYRKALRLMELAQKFGRPVIAFVDTPGAYPGIDAEERGQAEAIAFNLREMARMKTPIIVVVVGEGGSGGALAIAVGDHVIMLENAVYSVITPEGCAAILWKDAAEAPRAAEGLRLTASDLREFGLVDEILPEGDSGWSVAATDDAGETTRNTVYDALNSSIVRQIEKLEKMPVEDLLKRRYEKFRNMGHWLGERI